MFQGGSKWLLAAILLLIFSSYQSQSQVIDRVEPPNWWVGMANPDVQVLVYGKNISAAKVRLVKNKNVELIKVNPAESNNYLFLDLKIDAKAQAQTFEIEFKLANAKPILISYELKLRNPQNISSVDQSDVIYLITPDRFANGNPENDTVAGMKEAANRDFHGGRHGGDLEGVISKLDYLEDLGVTALWLNPVVENDMPEYSYHGYAITDFYKVDPRYGSNELYRNLSDQLQQRKMKLVMDMVFNHCGLEHWWMQDSPFADWVHDPENYQVTNHTIPSYSDPYASAGDLTRMERGWFVPSMPDLNHGNRFMANYLIQNSIWWVEFAGLDGIRMDTYPYNDKTTMQEWTKRVLTEYPGLFLLGETWVGDEAIEAYWAPKNTDSDEFNTGLTSTTDFPLCYAIHNAFKKDGDVKKLFETLSKDFLYDMPFANTTFVDNHDMDRFYYTIGKDVNRFNLAMTFLLTTRGTPQLYYGTEILLDKNNEHGDIRQDFPGGWASDSTDAFDYDQLNEDQKRAFTHLQKLLQFRKNNTVIQSGELKHFVPENNVYVYSRELEGQKMLFVLNNNDTETPLDLSRFKEVLNGFTLGTDVLSGEQVPLRNELILKPTGSLILELSEVNN